MQIRSSTQKVQSVTPTAVASADASATQITTGAVSPALEVNEFPTTTFPPCGMQAISEDQAGRWRNALGSIDRTKPLTEEAWITIGRTLYASVRAKTGAPLTQGPRSLEFYEEAEFFKQVVAAQKIETGGLRPDALEHALMIVLPDRRVLFNLTKAAHFTLDEIFGYLEHGIVHLAQIDAGFAGGVHRLPTGVEFFEGALDARVEPEYFSKADENVAFERFRARKLFMEGHAVFLSETWGALHKVRPEVMPYGSATRTLSEFESKIQAFDAQPTAESVHELGQLLASAENMACYKEGHALMERLAATRPELTALGFRAPWAVELMAMRKGHVAVPVPASASSAEVEQLKKDVQQMLQLNPYGHGLIVHYTSNESAVSQELGTATPDALGWNES